jgi:flagellar biosynthesis GTPase FlhF
MEDFRERPASNRRTTSSIDEKLNRILEGIEDQEEKKITRKEKTEWKMPNKWKRNVGKYTKKITKNKVLIMYLSAKGELEPPMYLPILGGNIIIHKDKAHEFDPSDMYLMKAGNKIAKVLIIREIDRKPISNKDWAEVKERGDSTRDDEVLLKMLKLAMVEKIKKQINKSLLWLLGIIGAGVVGYVLFFR